MRPSSGGYQELSSEVLFGQTVTHMAPLHTGSPLTPVSLTAQRFALSLPLVQIQMPLISNELQWQSRTMLSQERRNARRIHRNRGINRTQRQLAPLWEESEGVIDMYITDEQPSRERVETSTNALDHSFVEIQSHSSINIPSTVICNRTSTSANETHGTNRIQTDPTVLENRDCSKRYFSSLRTDMAAPLSTDTSQIDYCDSEDESFVRVNTFRALSVPAMSRQQPARKIAGKIVRLARANKIPNRSEMCCPDCGLMPILPVTGQCGHTRCTKCIKDKGACPCGVPQPESLHVNTLVQDIIAKMVQHYCGVRRKVSLPAALDTALEPSTSSPETVSLQRSLMCTSRRQRRLLRSFTPRSEEWSRHHLASIPARYEKARRLIALGRYSEAAPLLAHVASSTDSSSSHAKALLTKAIAMLSGKRGGRKLIRDLYRGVREQAASSWLKASDLECVLCCSPFMEPVTTPCGHNYCRHCIERAMDYRKMCALCQRPLDKFFVMLTKSTTFITAALSSIDALVDPKPLEPDYIHIFICTVTYPAISCPLLIFDPRYWVMVRRVVDSGLKKFGMVATDRERTYGDYGTLLEVRDCVSLENGSFILSTIGLSRFKVLDREVKYGCEVARVEALVDIPPVGPLMTWELRITSVQICYKALAWVHTMNKSILSEIVSTFGQMPRMEYMCGDWWESTDGPNWLWWLIAILPLKAEIKQLILSSQSLLKRMTAVYRTLEAIDWSSQSGELEVRRALCNTQAWFRRAY